MLIKRYTTTATKTIEHRAKGYIKTPPCLKNCAISWIVFMGRNE
jgi:hypothetical protein